ncbi:hypothetical protein Tco_0725858 [Tanacetum coccineum]|uniref:Uncharacterized protein n=1 Tax=Tanacetum coccineum TaxID=301880 RepID=A0ABQ4YEX9_9ASTR
MIHKGECNSPEYQTDAKREKQSKENCLVHFRIRHTFLEDISKEDLTNTCFSSGFQRAFSSLVGEDVEFRTKAIVERGMYKRAHDSRVNERMMQTREGMANMVKDKCDAGLVVT